MPRLVTHAIPLETVQRASTAVLAEVAEALGLAPEHVVLEVRQDPFVAGGVIAASHPFVELALFPRGAEPELAAVAAITRQLLAAGCASVDVYVRHLERSCYFEDGQALG